MSYYVHKYILRNLPLFINSFIFSFKVNVLVFHFLYKHHYDIYVIDDN